VPTTSRVTSTSATARASLTPAITSPAPPDATTIAPPAQPLPSGTPALRVLLPRPASTVQAPFAVQYQISSRGAAGGIRLTLGDGGLFALYLPIHGTSGVGYISDNRISGRRTLVFTLLDAKQRPFENPEATVRVPDVIIEGGK
jgi:hypothetical protein